jgi:NAD(P)-dependent dehydrogenase (short-subunit alcohol dehydrogenase family)
MFSLAGKNALVTGAGSGIGAAIAETFCRAGAKVFVSDCNETTGGALAKSLSSSHADGRARAEFMQLDVTSEADCAAAARQVVDLDGRLDILVNNAGIGHVGTMATTTGADFDRIMAVNTRGVFNVTRAFLPSMLARHAGVIVNIASIAGMVGLRDRLAYCASKFAVVGMTKAMALDHARDGIRINAICPGRVETPYVTERLKEYADPAKAYAEMVATQPMGRMGRPDEIAAAALYLASDEAAFITGATLTPDGGWSAG